MKVLPIQIEDDLDRDLAILPSQRGWEKSALVSDILRRFVDSEPLKRALDDPAPKALYAELEDEDVLLAEEGMGGYARLLREADQPCMSR